MRKFKLFSVLLCVILLFSSVFVLGASAATQGRITGNGVRMRNIPNTNNSSIITSLNKETIVTINGTATGNEAVSGGGTTWYYVNYGDKTGYVYGKYVEEIAESFDADFETNLLNFPESYRQPLRNIHNVYPNWIFKADNINLSLDDAINLEYSADNMFATRKWVELTYGVEWRDPRADVTNKEHIRESRWTFASRNAIAFFMDPRNALTVTAAKASYPNFFTFMEQSYDDTTQTVEGLRTIVAGTFLNTDSYISIIMDAATASGVSPYIIASTIITEQGTSGTSSLISGTYPGYEGYYNFFNYGASGSDVVVNGLEYAKKQGWNSVSAAITGGAKQYGSGYVSKGQDTYYYMDFNIKGSLYHQYAASLYDQCVKAYSARKAYISNYSGALTFKIPVYSGFPESAYAVPKMEDYIPDDNPQPTSQKGDINSDGVVNNKDLTRLFQYLSEWDVEVNPKAADVNGDKSVNNKDLTRLFQYLSGWDVEIYETE